MAKTLGGGGTDTQDSGGWSQALGVVPVTLCVYIIDIPSLAGIFPPMYVIWGINPLHRAPLDATARAFRPSLGTSSNALG